MSCVTEGDQSSQTTISDQDAARLKEADNRVSSPLCRLPEELLAKILLMTQSKIDELLYAADELFKWSGNVITVCRRIRSIALRSPELWCTIHFGYSDLLDELRWFELCRARSGHLLLQLYVSWTQANRFISQITAVAPRVQQVQIKVPDWDPDSEDDDVEMDASLWQAGDDQLLGRVLSSTMCQWRRLERVVVSTRTVGGHVAITSRLLGGPSDTLSHLRLEGLCIVRSFPQYLNMRHVSISSLDIEENPKALRVFLSQTPRLEVLDLDLIYISTLDWDPWAGDTCSSRKMHLPCLLTVTLTGYPQPILYILDMLPTPFHSLRIHPRRLEALFDVDMGTKILTWALASARRRVDNIPKQSYHLCVSLTGEATRYSATELILLELYFPDSARPYVYVDMAVDAHSSIDILVDALQSSRQREPPTHNLTETSFYVSDLTELRLNNYESYWTEYSQRVLGLTGYLQDRMRRGDPLMAVVVDEGPFPDGPEMRWLSERYIKEVRLADRATGSILRAYRGVVMLVDQPTLLA